MRSLAKLFVELTATSRMSSLAEFSVKLHNKLLRKLFAEPGNELFAQLLDELFGKLFNALAGQALC